MNDASTDPQPTALLPTSSAMVPTAALARLAELDREQLAGLVDDIDEALRDEGPMRFATGISGIVMMISGGISVMFGITTGLLGVVTILVDEDVRRLLRATRRARHVITLRVVRERAALQMTSRRELLLATVEAELAAELDANPDAEASAILVDGRDR